MTSLKNLNRQFAYCSIQFVQSGRKFNALWRGKEITAWGTLAQAKMDAAALRRSPYFQKKEFSNARNRAMGV